MGVASVIQPILLYCPKYQDERGWLCDWLYRIQRTHSCAGNNHVHKTRLNYQLPWQAYSRSFPLFCSLSGLLPFLIPVTLASPTLCPPNIYFRILFSCVCKESLLCCNSGCISLLLPILPMLPHQCYSNGLGNLGNLGTLKKIKVSGLLIVKYIRSACVWVPRKYRILFPVFWQSPLNLHLCLFSHVNVAFYSILVCGPCSWVVCNTCHCNLNLLCTTISKRQFVYGKMGDWNGVTSK